MLEIDELCVRRPGFALHLADRRLAAGTRLTIIGPSGGGKSTLLRGLLGLEPSVRLRGLRWLGADLAALPVHRRPFGWLPQELGLWPQLKAIEHVAFARTRGRQLRAAAEDETLLHELGIGHRARALPAQMSGGERQRLAFARVIAQRPAWAVLDEPFSNLDPVIADELGDAFFALARERGMGLIQVTHQVGRHQRTARDDEPFWVIEAGRLTQAGRWDELQRQPATPWIERFVALQH
ncbi:MAG: ATP-binding cassette domain-containing protein [Burkholderiaceae bacterium]|nr:ATP-binding cassette domain-containing protein [Burkholderiaceae bacterium]